MSRRCVCCLGSSVLSSTQAAHASPWHKAEKFSKSIQKVRRPQTGQSLHSIVERTVTPSSPMTSISQTTTLEDVSNIWSLFLRKVLKTCQAVSSVEKHPSARELPSSSTTEATKTRWTSSAIQPRGCFLVFKPRSVSSPFQFNYSQTSWMRKRCFRFFDTDVQRLNL